MTDLRVHDLRVLLDPVATFEAMSGTPALDWQRTFLRETRPTCVLKGRQVGASTAAAALAVHEARRRPDACVVLVSPSQKQSAEILGKARTGLRTLGVTLRTDSATMVHLASGGRIVSLPGTARSVRGWTATLLVLDECAYIEDETIVAARALIATGGRIVALSTPALEAGFFYQLVMAADPSWAHLRVPSDSVTTIPAAFLEAERRSMALPEFEREYLCRFGQVTWSGAFPIDLVDEVFGVKESA